jgi:hypothetical protein
LKKEHNPFMGWGTATLALVAWNHHAVGALSSALATALVAAQVALTLFFVSVKGWKHRWLSRSAA